MFEKMDLTRDRAIIQVFGLGEKGQVLCNYIEDRGVVDVDFFKELQGLYLNSVPTITSSNLALAASVEQGSGLQALKDADLNIYLVAEEDMADQLDIIEHYADTTCLNYLVMINHKTTVPEKLQTLINKMDLLLPLPYSPYHDNEVPYISNQNEAAYWFIRGICELVTEVGLICVDFADVRTVTCKGGKAVSLYSGWFSGENRLLKAVVHLFSLYDEHYRNLPKPKRVLANLFFGPKGFNVQELDELGENFIRFFKFNGETTFVLGTTVKPEVKDSIAITALFCDF